MRVFDWFRRLFRFGKEFAPVEEFVEEPIEEAVEESIEKPIEKLVEKVTEEPPFVRPRDVLLSFRDEVVDGLPIFDYIAGLLNDRILPPSYLRKEVAAMRLLPAVAWKLARQQEDKCPPEMMGLRNAAVEHARRVSAAVMEKDLTHG